MTGHAIHLRKHHRPWQVAGAAPQLAVDEITEPSAGKTERHQRRDEINGRQYAMTMFARIPNHGDHDTDKSAVEGHAALPHIKNAPRFDQVFAELVKQDITKAAAEDGAEDAVEQRVIQIGITPHRLRPRADRIAADQPDQTKTD